MARVAVLPLLLILSPLTGTIPGSRPGTGENVSVAAKLSQDGVRAGDSLRGALIVTIKGGWHLNSATPDDENLIGTSVSFSPPSGLSVGGVVFPRGTERKFAFSEHPVEVYDGTIVILFRVSAGAAVPPGRLTVPVEVSYQACNDDVCLAPATAHAAVQVAVLAPDVTPVPANQDLFGAAGSR